jgi:putative transposase
MARLPRLVLPGHAHLVVQPTRPGAGAFAHEADRRALLDALREGLALHQVLLHAWALHPDELRLVLTPPQAQSLARLMQHLGRRFVAAHHSRHGGRGGLWSGRYRCAALQDGSPVLEAMAWVEGSHPARAAGMPDEGIPAGATADPLPAVDVLQACSASQRMGQTGNMPLNDPPAFWSLGNTPFDRETAWRRRLSAGLPSPAVRRLEQALRGGWVVGNAEFAAQAAATSGRAAAPRPRGRPRHSTHRLPGTPVA